MENDIPDFNYESLKDNFNEERMNINFSSITVSNKRYFEDSYVQNKFDKILVQTPYSFFSLFDILSTNILKKIRKTKNTKSCFSSILYLYLKITKNVIPYICFLYIDLRFFNSKDFSSKEKTEVLLKEAFYTVTNKKEYNESKEIILKFNNYSNMIKKIEKIIKYFFKQKKILLIFAHIDFKFSEEFEDKLEIDLNEIPIIKIFSLDKYNIQKIFLEQIEMKPYKRDYLLMQNYPQINELSEKYSIFSKNPYYYGLRKTNNLSFNNLYNKERTKIFDILESFYFNNKRNLFYILSIKNIQFKII